MSTEQFPHLHDSNNRTALVEKGKTFSYAQLNQRINRCACGLLGDSDDLNEERIAFFLPASLDYVSVLHGVWRAGGIAVPLNVGSAVAELEHYLSNARVNRLITRDESREALQELCNRLGIQLLDVGQLLHATDRTLPLIDSGRRAMMLFTSGTTSKPKGVVTTHKTIRAQITTLIDAWAWSQDDVIPLFLPLHHIHGIINILGCGLWSGATVHMYARFDAPSLCTRIADSIYTVFMAVPTIYVKLIHYFSTISEEEKSAICRGFNTMRLNVSGSAACPVKLFNDWRMLTGQVLLERYGMTEIGMGISNPYFGERRAGYVGQPLPGVDIRLFDDQEHAVDEEGKPGEIRVRGENVFLEYWDNKNATIKSFKDGWFCTGDLAVVENGYYRIMGRSSIDIIKSGGYKLSALEIEGVLLTHDAISEVAVIGIEDEVWGEAVTAFICLNPGTSLTYDSLKRWCEGKMSSYKIPKQIVFMDSLPRNAMGKVTKSALKTET